MKLEKTTLRTWQREAKGCVTEELEISDRCRVVAPTGIGKTRLGVELAKKYGRTLVVSVRTKILAQYYTSMREQDPKRPILIISSKALPEVPTESWASPNDVNKIEGWLKEHKRSRKATIMCLYHSAGPFKGKLDLLTKTIGEDATWFDLALLDESHCSTGVENESSNRSWTQVHELYENYSERVVFMTATERVVDVVTEKKTFTLGDNRDANEQYGVIAYQLTFAKAVEQGLLADYKVWGMFSSESLTSSLMDEVEGMLEIKLPMLLENAKHSSQVLHDWKKFSRPITQHEIFRSWCVLEAIKKEKRKRCLLFFNRVSEMLRFNAILLALSQHEDAPIKLDEDQLFALYSGMASDKEQEVYDKFKSKVAKPVIISSVDMLTIGVDFPAADMAGLIEVRKGEIRLPQTIGRTTRKDGNKKSLVLVCGYLDEEGYLIDSDDISTNARQKGVSVMLKILEQLSKTDERMEQWVTSLPERKLSLGPIVLSAQNAPEIVINFPLKMVESLGNITIREAQLTGFDFEALFTKMEKLNKKYGQEKA